MQALCQLERPPPLIGDHLLPNKGVSPTIANNQLHEQITM